MRVFERSPRAGGVITTERTDGWLIEAGPNSLLSGEPALERLIEELGLQAGRIPANPAAAKRFILRRGQLHPAPLSPPALLASSLFSPLGKLAMLRDLVARPRLRTSDISLADFVRAHFGREFVDYALNPFVTGVYAGNPARLSARYAFPKLWEMEQKSGSLLRAQMAAAKARRAAGAAAPTIFSFRCGLGTLIESLANALPPGAITLSADLEAIVPASSSSASDRKWSIVWHDAAGTHTQSFDSLVLALPAHALASLRIGSLGERPLAALQTMEHPPVASLFLGYRREQVAHPLDGFGLLVPAIEKRKLLGALFSSTLFPERAPAGHVALTVLVGGTRHPELAALSMADLVSAVQPELSELLGVSGDPQFVRHNAWPRAIPQYNLGHEQFLAAIAATEKAHPALFIGGPARDGISVPACISSGERLATRASA